MKIFVLLKEYYHDNGDLMGVFKSVEEAKSASESDTRPGNIDWHDNGFYIRNSCIWFGNINKSTDVMYTIHEFEV